MRFSFISRRSGAGAALCGAVALACALTPCYGQSGRPSPIQFSPPRGERALTNLNEVRSSRREGDNLVRQRLEEDSRGASGLLNADDSSEPFNYLPPIYSPLLSSPRSKRLKQQADRRKNWFLMQPEDAGKLPTSEEVLDMPEYDSDGQPKKEKSAVERYYDKLDGKGARKPDRPGDGSQDRDEDRFGPKNDSAISDPFLSRSDGLPKDVLGNGMGDWLSRARDNDSMFAPSRPDNSALLFERTVAQQERLKEFRRSLESPSLPTPAPVGEAALPALARPETSPVPLPSSTPPFGLSGASPTPGLAPLPSPWLNTPPRQPAWQPNLPSLSPTPSLLQPVSPIPVRKF